MRLECSSKSAKAQIRLAKMSWQAVPKSRTSGGELTIVVTRTCSGDEARVDSRRSQLAAVCGGDELTVLCQIGWCCAMQSSKHHDSQFEVHECVLYTCNKFFEKLPECNHSASRRGYATGATTSGNRAAERQFDHD